MLVHETLYFVALMVVAITVGLSLGGVSAFAAGRLEPTESSGAISGVTAHSLLPYPSIVLSAIGASGNGTTSIDLGILGPVGSSFMTSPTPITITNNGNVTLAGVALHLGDQNNNATLQRETWTCLYSGGSILFFEPLVLIENYGEVAIQNLKLVPGATSGLTDNLVVDVYAGSESTLCGTNVAAGTTAAPGTSNAPVISGAAIGENIAVTAKLTYQD